jgi:DNA-binding response OmpR family regulator
MSEHTSPGWTVLIVDDEPGIRDLMTAWLDGDYRVRTAGDGEEALAAIDDSVDIALLDRRMPGMSGDELLEELRCRGYEIPVGMITAVTPDVDIVDMAFDDYVVKPVAKDELVRTVELLRTRADYDDQSRRFFRLASKRAKLRASQHIDHHTNPEYEALEAEMETLRDHLDEVLAELSETDIARAYQQI